MYCRTPADNIAPRNLTKADHERYANIRQACTCFFISCEVCDRNSQFLAWYVGEIDAMPFPPGE